MTTDHSSLSMKSIFKLSISGLWAIILSAHFFSALTQAAERENSLTVYAAASLINSLDEIGANFTKQTGVKIKFSYGASSTLARQIEAGAKVDLFFSADNEWMDYLQQRSLINKESRKPLLGNRLVLVAPINNNAKIKIEPGFALADLLGNERLAIADPDSVPAGKYAKAALLTLGAWQSVSNKLVRADNVRTTLAFVDRMEVPLGIVYETDALMDNKVRIVDYFPLESHPPIVYPVALATGATPGAGEFLKYLSSDASRQVLTKAGFLVMK